MAWQFRSCLALSVEFWITVHRILRLFLLEIAILSECCPGRDCVGQDLISTERRNGVEHDDWICV
jgi:hypothetical protein